MYGFRYLDNLNIYDLIGRDFKNGTHKGEYYVCCPYCEIKVGKKDVKYKMGVSLNKKVAHCFRCGTIIYFKSLNDEVLGEYKDNESLESLKERISNIGIKKIEKSKEILDLDIISNPIDKIKTPFAYSYLMDRGISLEEIRMLNIRVGKEYLDENKVLHKKWVGRILFPFIDNEEVIYIVGRTYIDQEPKYLNSKGEKTSLIYKVGDIKNRECILCEGIISALAAYRYTGIASICFLGKFPTDQQLYKIRYFCDKVYFSFDGDIERLLKNKIMRTLIGYGFEVFNVILPKDKDPDELKEDYINYFNKSKRFFII